MNNSLDVISISLANLSAVPAVTEFALNWLVQSTLLIAAGLVLARVFRAKGSATQSLIYRTTLAAVLVCPLATWTLNQFGVSGWSIQLPENTSQLIEEVVVADATPDLSPLAPPAAVETQPLLTDESPSTFPDPDLNESPIPNDPYPAEVGIERPLAVENSPNLALPEPSDSVEPTESAEPTLVADSTDTASDATAAKSFDWLGLLTLCIAVGWIITSIVFLARLVAAWWRLSRLVRDARPAEAETHQLCEELAATIGVTVPEILRSPFLASPCLTGLGLTRRPSILLPEDDSNLPLRDVIVHELAHLRRHDVHWNLLRQLATAVYFFQPLLWILSRRVEITAEEVCDDFVVQFGGDRERYATQLVDIAELSTDVSAAAVATAGVGIVALRSMLARRVERIMDGSRELSTRVGGLLLLLVLIAGLVGTSVVGLVGLNNAPALAEETVAETAVEKPTKAKPTKPKPTKANPANRRPRLRPRHWWMAKIILLPRKTWSTPGKSSILTANLPPAQASSTSTTPPWQQVCSNRLGSRLPRLATTENSNLNTPLTSFRARPKPLNTVPLLPRKMDLVLARRAAKNFQRTGNRLNPFA